MIELQRIIDELRFVLQGEVVEQTDTLKQLVAEYSDACHQANIRLRQCDDLLRQGLRSEALHLAEAAPNLLDAVALLDFLERSQLVEVLALSFLPSPEPLRVDAAAALNEAYAQHEPVKALLDRHRFLALARSPFSQRLAVLRSLADLEPTTAHWDTDVREMERARLREITASYETAAAEENTAILRELLRETDDAVWREEISAELKRNLKQSAGRIARAEARRRLTELEASLYQAHAALDASEARQLRTEWESQTKAARLSAEDPLIDSVAPIFGWLDDDERSRAQEQALQRAIAKLERGLDDDTLSAIEIARLGREVEKLDRALPETLEARFRSRLAQEERVESGRRRLIIGGCIAAVLAVACLVGTAVYRWDQGQKTQQILSAVDSYVAEGQLGEARKLMTANAERGGTEEWFAIEKRLAAAESAENDRRVELEALLSAAQNATESDDAAIRRARELARTAEEKVAVGKLEASWRQMVQANVASREKQFREKLDSVTKSLVDLDGLLGEPVAHTDPRVRSLLADATQNLTNLRATKSKVAPELATQADVLGSRFQSSQKRMEDLTRQAAMLDKLTDATSSAPDNVAGGVSPERYAAALKAYGDAFPNHPRTTAFKEVLEANTFAAADAKSRLLAKWRKFWPGDAADAIDRLKDCRSFLTAYPQSPDRRSLERYEECLKAFERRFIVDGESSEGTTARFTSLFSGPLIANGNVLRDRDGNSYYLKDPKDVTGMDPVTFVHVVGTNGETRRQTLRAEKLAISKTELPAQRELAKTVLKAMSEAGMPGWDEFLLETAQVLVKDKKMDAFLRYVLVLRTLEWAGQGNPWLQVELAPLLTKMGSDRIDLSAEWMDPQNATANAERRKVAELFPAEGDLELAWKSATEHQQSLAKELFRNPSPVGWLERTADRKWRMRSHWQTNKPHHLFAASPPGAQGLRIWQNLGTADEKGIVLSPADTDSLREGTVVFALPAVVGNSNVGSR